MLKSIISLIIGCALFAVCADTSLANELSDEALAKVQSATAYIEVEENGGRAWSGSGFFINGDGLLLTNYHVTSGESVSLDTEFGVIVSPGTANETRHMGKFIAFHPTMDLALVKTTANSTTWLKISDDELKLTQPVLPLAFHMVVGFPGKEKRPPLP